MIVWATILLLLVQLGSAAPRARCPQIPSTCQCDPQPSGKLVVTCDGAVLSSLFKDLGALPLERLSVVNCSQPVLDVLPRGPVRSLEISGCRIQSVDNKVFKGVADSLEELILSNNSLTTIPLFGPLPKLVSLNLNGNKLTDVAEKSLEGLRSLRQLRLENNKICALSPNALNEIKPSLELLDVSGNCFSAVPAQNLRNSVRLMYLDLSDNKIGEVNNFELMNLPVLKEIRLNNNELRTMHPMAFMNVPRLQFLFLKDNLLAALDGTKLQALQQLEVLDVTNNLLPKVPILKDFPNLSQVRLDGNLIEKIETLTFSNNTRLMMISLQNNNIAQISRNSFDSLDQMQILLLTNNSISSLDRGVLDGMRNLAQLNLRNNSLTKVDPSALLSVPQLTTLDLAYNKMDKIAKKTFLHLSKLFWLDLSNNRLQGFEQETFNKKTANILLDGNQWECDEKFDWFVTFLVANQVRTFLPFQKEISCAGPEKYVGVRLKDLMMKKANDTITEGMKTLGLDKGNQKSLISSFIPGFDNYQNAANAQALGNMAAGVPILHTITQAIPSLRSLPGLYIPSGTGAQNVPMNRNLNGAIEQFTAPLVRFATGGQPVASDISQLIQSIPNFIVNVPGMGDIDISKLDPNMIDYVLKGGQIPGLSKEALDGIVQQYMQKVHAAAAAAQAGTMSDDQANFLPPMDKLPQEFVTNVMKGEPLPGLDKEQTKTVTEYYTKAIPVANPASVGSTSNGGGALISAQMMELWKLLPSGYNISKIPADVISAVTKGEMPDLSKLPTDLLEHFKANSDKMANMFSKMAPTNASIEEMLAKLPKFEKPVLATFSPYDINKLSSEMIHEEELAAKAAKMRIYTAIVLGLVGAVTIVVVAVFVVYIRKQRRNKSRVAPPPVIETRGMLPGAPLANSTMRDSEVEEPRPSPLGNSSKPALGYNAQCVPLDVVETRIRPIWVQVVHLPPPEQTEIVPPMLVGYVAPGFTCFDLGEYLDMWVTADYLFFHLESGEKRLHIIAPGYAANLAVGKFVLAFPDAKFSEARAPPPSAANSNSTYHRS